MDTNPGDVTRLLRRMQNGDHQAANELIPLVYDELRKLAGYFVQRERTDATLQATALVHEAYLRMIGHEDNLQNRAHLLALVARVMRQILVDRARNRKAGKRGGDQLQVPLDQAELAVNGRQIDVLALHIALDHLTALDPRQGQIIEMRYFGGMTVEEIAAVLGVATKTVQRECRSAEALLRGELSGSGGDDSGALVTN